MRGRRYFGSLVVAGAVTAATIAPAGALSRGGGSSAQAPGQARATANCEDTVLRQEEAEVWPGGGPKTEAGYPGPTNCDHWYQDDLGLIGGGG